MKAEWRGLDRLVESLRNFKRRLFPGTIDYIYRTADQIREEISKPGSPPTYPINWDSERQRKAFFATDGFGRGIPTKRSNEYVEAYHVVRREDGAEVGNPLSHAKFIGGRAQSNIHKGRWPIFWEVADVIIQRLPDKVKKRIVVIAQEAGLRIE